MAELLLNVQVSSNVHVQSNHTIQDIPKIFGKLHVLHLCYGVCPGVRENVTVLAVVITVHSSASSLSDKLSEFPR